MRGIQINNFYENHISLNVINSHRPKPIVIHHGRISPEPLLLTDSQSPNMKNRNNASAKRKKRANTHMEKPTKMQKLEKSDKNILISKQTCNINSNSATKKRVSISLQKMNRNNNVNRKKFSQEEEQSDRQSKEEKYFQMTSQRKLKPVYKLETNPSNLGRSKSAIIKPLNYNHKSYQFQKNHPSQFDRSQKKKVVKNSLKKSTKPIERKKSQKDQKNQKGKSKVIEPTFSKQTAKTEKFSSERKASKSNMTTNIPSAKQSKPISARGPKGTNWKKKLFEEADTTPLIATKKHKKSRKNVLKEQHQDQNEEAINYQMKDMIDQLQGVLSNIGTLSKKKLKKQLQIITQRLKNAASENHSEDQQDNKAMLRKIQQLRVIQERKQKERQNQNDRQKYYQQVKKIAQFEDRFQEQQGNQSAEKYQDQQNEIQYGQNNMKYKQKYQNQQQGDDSNQDASFNMDQTNMMDELRKKYGNKYNIEKINQDLHKFGVQKLDIDEYLKDCNGGEQIQFMASQNIVIRPKDEQQNLGIREQSSRARLGHHAHKSSSGDLGLTNERIKQYQSNNGQCEQIPQYEQDQYQNQFQKYKDQYIQANLNEISEVARNESNAKNYRQAIFKQQTHQNLKQRHLGANQMQGYARVQKNPILERNKNWQLVSDDNYDSSKSNQQHYYQYEGQQEMDEAKAKQIKRRQIESLKNFKVQSNYMMKKIDKIRDRQQDKPEEKAETKPTKRQVHDGIKEKLAISVDEQVCELNKNKVQREKDIQKMLFSNEKYSVPSLKSPRFNELELTNIISVKEKFLHDRHDKMNTLVDKMYEKHLVSPRSYEMHLYLLRKKQQQESHNLQSFKKQAEQINHVIKGIKKDKQEIQGIDELIRNEKWDQALQLMKKYKLSVDKIELIQNRSGHSQRSKTSDKSERQRSAEELSKQKQIFENNHSSAFSQKSQRKSLEEDDQIIYNYEPSEQNDTQGYSGVSSGGVIKLLTIEQQSQAKQIQQDGVRDLQIQQRMESMKAPELKVQSMEEHDQNYQDEEEGDLPEMPDAPSNVIIRIDDNPSSVFQKQTRGFDSNLYFIKEYCIALCEHIKSSDSELGYFKENIRNPSAFDLVQLLASYRQTTDGQYTRSFSSLKEQLEYPFKNRIYKQSPISNSIFDSFNSEYDKLKANKDDKCSQSDKKLQLTFLKSIFDALNESLNFERPGSLNGKPLPWLHHAKHLKNHKYSYVLKPEQQGSQFQRKIRSNTNELEQIDLIFGLAIARIINWGSCLCGFIPDTVDFQNTEIDEEYVNHLRQTRMALLLEKMLIDEEAQLANTQMFQTQVLLACGQKIFEEIIDQIEKDLKIISLRSTIRSVDY